ncbi:MAG: DUF1343 domain-containing protein [Gammaproteobacteria bacterium]|nr:DUF1343 domain-containing protein [Gammaproteobacteria bacterium]
MPRRCSLYGPTSAARPQGMLDDTWIVVSVRPAGCRLPHLYLHLDAEIFSGGMRRILPFTRIVVLDRPNPAGRPIDGLMLESGQESFVGCDELPTRHGLTVGELARWSRSKRSLDVELTSHRDGRAAVADAGARLLAWPAWRSMPVGEPEPRRRERRTWPAVPGRRCLLRRAPSLSERPRHDDAPRTGGRARFPDPGRCPRLC